METTITTPVLNSEELQKKINQYALEGAIASIKEYYTGYDSPFKKAITEELKKKEIGHINLNLPDILAIINDTLSKEIEVIANHAISQTYLPLVKRILVRAEKEIKFSNLLEAFIESHEYDSKDYEDYSCEVEKSSHGWLNVTLNMKDKNYEITLHEDYKSKEQGLKKYCLLSMPRSGSPRTMKLKVNDAELEIPFTQNILQDKFVAYLATLIIADSVIEMDCEEFNEDMFPEKCHCD